MKINVYVAYADDHDYDCMSQWLVGVYTTREKAELAIERDRHEKKKEHKETFGKSRVSFRYNSTIEETELDLD